jgi:hypothetical protein
MKKLFISMSLVAALFCSFNASAAVNANVNNVTETCVNFAQADQSVDIIVIIDDDIIIIIVIVTQ